MNINNTDGKNVLQFLDELASKAPTPGGGGAAAMVGAVGIALGNMVGSLTVGKKKYATVEAEIIELNKRAEELRKDLYELIRGDAEAFMPVSQAYSIPKDDPMRGEVMEAALKGAAEVPLRIMKCCCKAICLIEEYANKGSVLAISDAGCAAVVCKAALESAALNVYINTKSMKDRRFAESMNIEVKNMMDEYCPMALKVYESVAGRLH